MTNIIVPSRSSSRDLYSPSSSSSSASASTSSSSPIFQAIPMGYSSSSSSAASFASSSFPIPSPTTVTSPSSSASSSATITIRPRGSSRVLMAAMNSPSISPTITNNGAANSPPLPLSTNSSPSSTLSRSHTFHNQEQLMPSTAAILARKRADTFSSPSNAAPNVNYNGGGSSHAGFNVGGGLGGGNAADMFALAVSFASATLERNQNSTDVRAYIDPTSSSSSVSSSPMTSLSRPHPMAIFPPSLDNQPHQPQPQPQPQPQQHHIENELMMANLTSSSSAVTSSLELLSNNHTAPMYHPGMPEKSQISDMVTNSATESSTSSTCIDTAITPTAAGVGELSSSSSIAATTAAAASTQASSSNNNNMDPRERQRLAWKKYQEELMQAKKFLSEQQQQEKSSPSSSLPSPLPTPSPRIPNSTTAASFPFPFPPPPATPNSVSTGTTPTTPTTPIFSIPPSINNTQIRQPPPQQLSFQNTYPQQPQQLSPSIPPSTQVQQQQQAQNLKRAKTDAHWFKPKLTMGWRFPFHSDNTSTNPDTTTPLMPVPVPASFVISGEAKTILGDDEFNASNGVTRNRTVSEPTPVVAGRCEEDEEEFEVLGGGGEVGKEGVPPLPELPNAVRRVGEMLRRELEVDEELFERIESDDESEDGDGEGLECVGFEGAEGVQGVEGEGESREDEDDEDEDLFESCAGTLDGDHQNSSSDRSDQDNDDDNASDLSIDSSSAPTSPTSNSLPSPIPTKRASGSSKPIIRIMKGLNIPTSIPGTFTNPCPSPVPTTPFTHYPRPRLDASTPPFWTPQAIAEATLDEIVPVEVRQAWDRQCGDDGAEKWERCVEVMKRDVAGKSGRSREEAGVAWRILAGEWDVFGFANDGEENGGDDDDDDDRKDVRMPMCPACTHYGLKNVAATPAHILLSCPFTPSPLWKQVRTALAHLTSASSASTAITLATILTGFEGCERDERLQTLHGMALWSLVEGWRVFGEVGGVEGIWRGRVRGRWGVERRREEEEGMRRVEGNGGKGKKRFVVGEEDERVWKVLLAVGGGKGRKVVVG
ncbi:hypothetical protein HDU97_001932 [Phlyctochytrium planicorne]|nr:hypothetical protein HDU97_001932 [Phlyctochytrium planicorne]